MYWLGLSALTILTGCAHFRPQPISVENAVNDFEARSLTNATLREFLATNHVAAPQGPWDIETLTLVGLCYQPALAEARAQLWAAHAAEITARHHPNPSLTVTPTYNNQIPGAPSPWIVPLSIDVPIETAGKRGKRLAQAEHLSEAARWNLIGIIWQVRSQVRAALVNLYSAREAETLLYRQEIAQSNIVHLLEGQLSVGMVSAFEVTQARSALQTTQLAQQDMLGKLAQARITLAHILGLPIHALHGVEFSFTALNRFPRELTEPDIRRQALFNRADVRSALAEYAASQSALQLEIANQYPDVHLGPGYAWNSGNVGDNEWSLGLTVTLPVLNHNQGPIAEAQARRSQAAAHFLTVQANAIAEIDSALAAYQGALHQVTIANQLLENLQKHLESVGAMEQAGQLDPLAVAAAEVEFNTGAQSRLDALIKAQTALGQLEDSMQSSLTFSPQTIRAAETNPLPLLRTQSR